MSFDSVTLILFENSYATLHLFNLKVNANFNTFKKNCIY